MLLGCSAFGAQWTVYVGTYTGTESKGGTDSKGIYALRFDDLTGTLTSAGLAAETSNPSFLALSPNRRFLYAANENSLGSVSAFAIDPQGKLKLLNTVSSLGSGPCHVAIDKTGKWLFVANYNSGSVAAYRVNDDGKLGNPAAFYQHSGSSVDPQRQTGPHAHSVNLSPDNRFVLTTDLGLIKSCAIASTQRKGWFRRIRASPKLPAALGPGIWRSAPIAASRTRSMKCWGPSQLSSTPPLMEA